MLICLVGSVILILDDLASHMTTANEAKEALKFLAEFLTTVKKSVHSSKVSFFLTTIHIQVMFDILALFNLTSTHLTKSAWLQNGWHPAVFGSL